MELSVSLDFEPKHPVDFAEVMDINVFSKSILDLLNQRVSACNFYYFKF